jgi:pectin methylesterase-like acyl-CoA thioesterase
MKLLATYTCLAVVLGFQSAAAAPSSKHVGKPSHDPHKFQSCQAVKAAHQNPLEGCPAGTVYVSAVDKKARYQSVQAAIDSVAQKKEATILIGSGVYHEVINITSPGSLTLLGQTSQPGNWSANLVTIWNSSAIPMLPTGADDADTVTFTVAPSRAAALIGAGFYGAPIVNNTFGSPDFKAYNLNVENRYANYSAGQALALGVSYANASFVSNEDFRGMSATQGLTSSVRSLVRMCFPIVSRYYLCWTVWFSVL